MIKQIILRVILYSALAYAFATVLGREARASNSLKLQDEEPAISVYQGTEKGTSVIVLQWMNGKTERLLFKNGDKHGYILWFNERLREHEEGIK